MTKLKTRLRHSPIHDDIEKLKKLLALTAHDVSGEAKSALHDSYENMIDKSTDFEHSVANYVNHKPLKALAIAVLSGLVLGLSMRKKRRHR